MYKAALVVGTPACTHDKPIGLRKCVRQIICKIVLCCHVVIKTPSIISPPPLSPPSLSLPHLGPAPSLILSLYTSIISMPC